MARRTPTSTLFPYTTLFRSSVTSGRCVPPAKGSLRTTTSPGPRVVERSAAATAIGMLRSVRSEEHTSELQSRFDLVCRLLLEKKKIHVSQLPPHFADKMLEV